MKWLPTILIRNKKNAKTKQKQKHDRLHCVTGEASGVAGGELEEDARSILPSSP